MMLRVKQFFESRLNISSSSSQNDIDHKLKLGCAVLMFEMVHVDGDIHDNEEQKIRQALQQQFNITDAETEELLTIAHEKKNTTADYYQFTSMINQHYSQEQKIFLVEQLWHIAYADNVLDKFEEHLVRKLAELLHVPHRHFMQSKHRAENKT
ncbi:MAG: TerB family tellurite resistance protein [Gammaproteobacteria bacterium]|nr:TerB family tellurite resistance protein [Gammaproteobacteria bacterium]